jgi:5,10-methylene-tetrahydrofolate dehydrogenase/methenyl tetrahydrofolate cyclohydrolase
MIQKASKGESLEELIKTLLVEKVMNVMGVLINRPVVKKVAKKAVKKGVDNFWEANRDKLMEKVGKL